MLDGGTNCGKGEQLWQPYMVRGDHLWHRVWSGQTTCGADNLWRDRPAVKIFSIKYLNSANFKISPRQNFALYGSRVVDVHHILAGWDHHVLIN